MTDADRTQPLMAPYEPPGKLCIVSLGGSPDDAEERARSAVRSCFKLNCEILSPEPRPEFVLDASRDQCNSLKILDWLESRLPRPGLNGCVKIATVL